MKKIVIILLHYCVICPVSFSQVRLPRLISDGMILQRDTPLKIWGWAAPGEKVSLVLSSNKDKGYSTVANKKGEWSVTLLKQKAGGPYYMKIEATNHLVIENILIGDVWLCSGQSNMEQPMSGRLKYKYADEIATANNNNIRQFLVPDKYNFNQPQQDVESGSWKEANPKNIVEFTAVGYFFAKELYAKYKVPIGLINAALGGSAAESWISESSLKKFPGYYNEMQKFKDTFYVNQTEMKDRIAGKTWNHELDVSDKGSGRNWRDPIFNDTGWQNIQIPGYWANTIPGPFYGVVWFRKEIIVPAAMTGRPAKIELGRIIDTDSVFINGVFVGNTTYQYPARRYELNNTILKEGKNVIVIRVVSSSGNGGFVPGKKYELTTATGTIDLSGNWKFQTGAKAAGPFPPATNVRLKPGGLHNAMIAPLTNYAIKGVTWYQGESNTGKPEEYSDLMQALIRDWRTKWENDDLPFLIVQLPNFMEAKKTPQESNWAALRQQQLYTSYVVPKTGMAVTIDIGEWNDLHPENKKEVGHRLALQALSVAYGENRIQTSGPQYWSSKTEGNKIIIEFTSTGEGLTVKGKGELKHFAIAGKDGKYVWANAKIRYGSVIVWNDAIPEPVAVRYAWADNPEGANLFNKDGLPASPFTTVWPK